MSIVYKRFGAMEIDGATNAVDTDKSLFTMGANLSGIANILVNNKSVNSALVRVAIIENDVIGAVAEEDYIEKDQTTIPAGGKLDFMHSMNEGDTILVRSNIVDVNFIADGMEQDK